MAPNLSAADSLPVHLKIFVDPLAPDWLLEKYESAIRQHNEKMVTSAPYSDSGFDLFVPITTSVLAGDKVWIDHKIKCAMTLHGEPTGFYLYPRSSICKTTLMLCNGVGIIDAGYRGSLIGCFQNTHSSVPYSILRETRLLQICHPSLTPIFVKLVQSEADLGDTNRGSGGFGSTGGV